MKQQHNLFIILLILVVNNLHAQGQSDIEARVQQSSAIDTAFIHSYYDRLILGFSLPKKYVDFSINDIRNDKSLDYQPNTNTAIGFKGAYKWLGISVAFGIPQTAGEIEKYGKTERFDIQLNTYLRKIVIDGYFQFYKGMYLMNMDEYFDDFSEDTEASYYKRPDLIYGNLGISARYVWNHKKFSYKAAYDFNETQKKGAGSFLLGGYAFLSSAGADSTFVPHFARDDFSDTATFAQISAVNFGISAGYIRTFLIGDHFFITIGVTPGIGLQGFTAYDVEENEVMAKSGAGLSFVSRIALGYTKKNFYAVLTGVSGSNNLVNKDITAINFGYGNSRITIGYRFRFRTTDL